MTNVIVNVTAIVVRNSVESDREADAHNGKPASAGSIKEFWQKHQRLILFVASCVFHVVLRYCI